MPTHERKETKKSLIEQLKEKGCRGYSNMNIDELKEYLRICEMDLNEVRDKAKRLYRITDVHEMKKPELARALVMVKTLLDLKDERLPYELANLISGYARSPNTPLQEAMNEITQLIHPRIAFMSLLDTTLDRKAPLPVNNPDVYIFSSNPSTGEIVAGVTARDFVRNAKAMGIRNAHAMQPSMRYLEDDLVMHLKHDMRRVIRVEKDDFYALLDAVQDPTQRANIINEYTIPPPPSLTRSRRYP